MKTKSKLNEDMLPGEREAPDHFDLSYDSLNGETLEDHGWEYVASKDVYDENGFRDVYYWYKKDGNNRFFFSRDVDYGDPEYFDWETEGEESAQEWFDSYEEESLEEGISGNMSAENIAKKHNASVESIKAQVEKGIKVEKEHTDDEKKAERIALDHLFEIPDYYDRLDKMEKSTLKEETESSRPEKIIQENISPRINLTKYGFKRLPEKDFKDDETTFRMYEYKGLPVSYAYGLSFGHFISGRPDYLPNAKYAIYSKIPGYRDLDALNGEEIVTKDDIEKLKDAISSYMNNYNKEEKSINEDTVKQGSSWVNKGDTGETHGTFRTKKAADAQRRAMFANGYKESLEEGIEETPSNTNVPVASSLITAIEDEWKTIALYNAIIDEFKKNGFEDMIPVIQDIVEEENTHVGQLQKALETISPDVAKIRAGEVEADSQLNEEYEDDLDTSEVEDYVFNNDCDIYTTLEACSDEDCADLSCSESSNREHIEYALAQGDIDKDAIIDYVLKNTPDEMLAGVVDLIGEFQDTTIPVEPSTHVEHSDDLEDSEINIEVKLAECDAVPAKDCPEQKEKLQEFGPVAAAVVGAVAPVVAKKVVDKILPEDQQLDPEDTDTVNGAGIEDDLDVGILSKI